MMILVMVTGLLKESGVVKSRGQQGYKLGGKQEGDDGDREKQGPEGVEHDGEDLPPLGFLVLRKIG